MLKNEIAIQVSINIMNAFVEMRKFIATDSNIFNLSTRMEHKFLEYDKKFDIVFDSCKIKKKVNLIKKYSLMDKFMIVIV